MENHHIRTEQKLTMIMQHAGMALAEIDRSGKILHLNTKEEALLKPVLIANDVNGNNLYPVLDHIAPAIAQERKPVNLQNIINDSLSILFASLDKMAIGFH